MTKLTTTRRDFAKLLAGGAALGVATLSSESSAIPTGQRETISLDGEWKIAESVEPDVVPTAFDHTVPF
jgi:hypothetical protein